jgi:hypothetical protein
LLPVPTHLSWSQVSKLAGRYPYSCARAWAYDKRLGLPFVSSPALLLGSAIDAGANAFFKVRMAGGEIDTATEAAGTAAGHEWSARLAEATMNEALTPEREALYVQALGEALAVYCAARAEIIPGAVQQKHTFTVRAAAGHAITVIGYSDRIDADGTIVDLKYSGSAKWDSAGNWNTEWVDEKRDQLAIYYLARIAEWNRFRNRVGAGDLTATWGGPEVVPRARLEVVYHRVGMRTPQFRLLDLEFHDADVERVVANIREADERARSGIYPARPGAACQWCSHVTRCREDEAQRTPRFTDLTGIPEAL